MEDLSINELSSQEEGTPVNEDAYKRIRGCLVRLAHVRQLIRDDTHDALLPCDENHLNTIYNRFVQKNPEEAFILTSYDVDAQTTALYEGRKWLLFVIVLHERTVANRFFIRTIRSATEKPPSEHTDVERMYFELTNLENGDPEARLDYTFALILHHRYADKHADILAWLLEVEDRKERIRSRIKTKALSSKVDNFTCAVPASLITDAADVQDRCCPICREEYLDFETFRIENIIENYPTRIKYCGHIVGKSCLETWLDTPLADPALYPNHTCPICRANIDGVPLPTPPRLVQYHLEQSTRARSLAHSLGLGAEACRDGLLRLVSDEIVAVELLGQLEGANVGEETIGRARAVLEKRVREVEKEKKAWGWVGGLKEEEWKKVKGEWSQSGSQV